ncbi:hypothetical protein NW755_001954 [Fusarium falciforme]|uniref:Uncharacterized protein n=1 Tax=Fusarium falciforme TaxID=195108 RepID=A0A9W8RI23_9HYPO|nr:hypothetical protein NW755_001954 [Fusarium falciforme]
MKQMQDDYPGYVFTLAPDISLATLAITELRPQLENPNANSFKALHEQHVWDYLHQAIEVAEARGFASLIRKLLIVAAIDAYGTDRPREEQITSHTSRPQTKRIVAGATTVSVPAIPFAEPYPKRRNPMTMTADEWEPKHAHWLDEIPKRRCAGKTAYTAIIEKEVTKETVPLIRERRRDDIFNWLTRESPKSKALQLLDAPFADSIESQTTIDAGFVEEPDMIRQALREIEGIVF